MQHMGILKQVLYLCRVPQPKLAKKGEIIIIMSFSVSDKAVLPKTILVNENNEFMKFLI